MYNCICIVSLPCHLLFVLHLSKQDNIRANSMSVQRRVFQTCKVFDYHYHHCCVITHFLISDTHIVYTVVHKNWLVLTELHNFCIVLMKFEVGSFSHSRYIQGSQNFKGRSRQSFLNNYYSMQLLTSFV